MKQQRFNIGEQVIALKSFPLIDSKGSMHLPIVKGKKYIVDDTVFCTKCGSQLISVNVNYVLSEKFNHTELECDCGCTFNAFDTKLYDDAKYFIKQDVIQETIQEAIQVENYELAGLLTSLGK